LQRFERLAPGLAAMDVGAIRQVRAVVQFHAVSPLNMGKKNPLARHKGH
jgi:hypothetical protein